VHMSKITSHICPNMCEPRFQYYLIKGKLFSNE
jgi:hypothetical protein